MAKPPESACELHLVWIKRHVETVPNQTAERAQARYCGGLVLLMGSVICTGKDITEEPDAVIPHVRICLGAARVTGRPTKTVNMNWKHIDTQKNLDDFNSSN